MTVRRGCHHREMVMPVIEVLLDPPLLRALRRRADSEGLSLNELIRRYVRDGLNSEQQARGLGLGPPPSWRDQVGDDAPLSVGAPDGGDAGLHNAA